MKIKLYPENLCKVRARLVFSSRGDKLCGMTAKSEGSGQTRAFRKSKQRQGSIHDREELLNQ